MTARVCPSCQYSVLSSVARDCPNCGGRLPRAATAALLVPAVLIVGAGAAAVLALRGGDTAARGAHDATPTTLAAPAAAPPSPDLAPAEPADEEARIDRLIAQLGTEEGAWTAADELVGVDHPRARRALMEAYDRREYGKMAGAAAFYARTRPPRYAEVLVTLLRESKDLAVAQALILSGDRKLVGPAEAWAADRGFKLVKDPSVPPGVSWTSSSR